MLASWLDDRAQVAVEMRFLLRLVAFFVNVACRDFACER